MKRSRWTLLSFLTFVVFVTFAFSSTNEGFESLDSREEEQAGEDAYNKMMDVLTHKRCLNCHPSGSVPKQGEDSHLHNFAVVRGEEGLGLFGYDCSTCHQKENNRYSGVPGAPHWAMAPASMAWEGLSRAEIAESILDRSKNGNRSLEDIVRHMTEDALVLWAWEPGSDAEGNPREVPPVSKEDFIEAVKEWAAGGAAIPQE